MATASEAMRTWVDVHLVIEDPQLQLNRWRNVARFYARTDYVVMHDVDFWLPSGIRSKFKEPKLLAALKEGKQAFAIPCFYALNDELAEQPQNYPETKSALKQGFEDELFGIPNMPYKPSHWATDYARWFRTADNSTDYYPISTTHPEDYEPYFVFNTHTTP